MENILETLKTLSQKGLTLKQVIAEFEKEENERFKKLIDDLAGEKSKFPIKDLGKTEEDE